MFRARFINILSTYSTAAATERAAAGAEAAPEAQLALVPARQHFPEVEPRRDYPANLASFLAVPVWFPGVRASSLEDPESFRAIRAEFPAVLASRPANPVVSPEPAAARPAWLAAFPAVSESHPAHSRPAERCWSILETDS